MKIEFPTISRDQIPRYGGATSCAPFPSTFLSCQNPPNCHMGQFCLGGVGCGLVGMAKDWAPVSEPEFLVFLIFRFPILEIFVFSKVFSKIMLVKYRGINDKGVLERPGTKWKVLRTISSTLKFQECQKS